MVQFKKPRVQFSFRDYPIVPRGSAKLQVARAGAQHTVQYYREQRSNGVKKSTLKGCRLLIGKPSNPEIGSTQNGVGTWIEKPMREIGAQRYQRYVLRTHLVRAGERLDHTLLPYLEGRVAAGDIVVLGEKIVAIAEGRAILLKSVKPRPIARVLSRHVRQLGYGMGLRRAETMEMAIREVGLGRILLAATVGAIDRILGRSGDFYRVAGRQVAAIDGPGPTTIPPFNQYIVLAPAKAQSLVDSLSKKLGAGAAVVDVNDVGSEVLAWSKGISRELVEELLRDNPMGQGAQQTPVGVLRPATVAQTDPAWPKVLPPQRDGGYISPVPGMGDSAAFWAGSEVASANTGRSPLGKGEHGKVDSRRL